jgi:glycosyltransferase involved in cell wall biosynthesis
MKNSSNSLDSKKLLHICSDLARQSIYSDLLAELRANRLSQIAYAAVRTHEELRRITEIRRRTSVPVHLRKLLTPLDRVFFRRKVSRITRDLETVVDLSKISLVHAHFLYSDGAVALQINRRRKIPFIVSVRNTDVNLFMRLRPDLLRIATEVLLASRAIVFVTPSYVARVLKKLDASTARIVQQKIEIVPNGISARWLEDQPISRCHDSTVGKHSVQVVYVGDFSRNKNVKKLIAAVELLNRRRPARITLVGAGGADQNWVRKRASSVDGVLTWRGRVEDSDELRRIYREHDVFVMVSHKETFGLVYLEALSQGLPVVHSRGEGIDGYFNGLNIAESADPTNIKEIAEKIEILADRSAYVGVQCREIARAFEWGTVARRHLSIYRDAIFRK